MTNKHKIGIFLLYFSCVIVLYQYGYFSSFKLQDTSSVWKEEKIKVEQELQLPVQRFLATGEQKPVLDSSESIIYNDNKVNTMKTKSVKVNKVDQKENQKKKKEEDQALAVGERMDMYVKSSVLKLRVKPNNKAKVIAYLEKGNKVQITEQVDQWWSHIKFNEFEGYVCTEYLTNDKK